MGRHICSAIAKQLPLLVQDELSEEEKRLTLTHLSECSRCQNAYEKLHRTFGLVQSWKTEPETFEAFNRTLFERIRGNRLSQMFVLRPALAGNLGRPGPARRILRPAVLAPVVSLCLILLTIGVWQKTQQIRLAKAESSLNELSLLETLGEEIPEADEELLEEEVLSQDEILLVEATEAPRGEDLLQELELLEQIGEAEGVRDDSQEELEEEFLLTDQELSG